MALSSPPYTNDAIWAQDVHLFIAGNPTEVGGMQSIDLRTQIPKNVEADTQGKSRFRRTGPIICNWTARRWMLYKQGLIDLLGSDVVQDATKSYGNYNWDQLIFDMVEQYSLLTPQGVASQTGGITLRYCTVTDWGVGHSDPFAFWTEDLQGIALGSFQNSWT